MACLLALWRRFLCRILLRLLQRAHQLHLPLPQLAYRFGQAGGLILGSEGFLQLAVELADNHAQFRADGRELPLPTPRGGAQGLRRNLLIRDQLRVRGQAFLSTRGRGRRRWATQVVGDKAEPAEADDEGEQGAKDIAHQVCSSIPVAPVLPAGFPNAQVLVPRTSPRT